jgi:GMP synthase (glutamine-hydrolysing)
VSTVPRVLVLQHHPLENAGVYAETLRAAGAELDIVRGFAGDRYPRTLERHDGLIVMGGPMSVNDALPWLAAERALVTEAIAADLPTLGVCLGSQLIASAAGATVARGPVAEIGWHRITPNDAVDDRLFANGESFAALEWHSEAFPLPSGAVALASSARYPLQAFRLGRNVYGMLFHLEVDAPLVAQWCVAFGNDGALPQGDAEPDFDAANRRAAAITRALFLAPSRR